MWKKRSKDERTWKKVVSNERMYEIEGIISSQQKEIRCKKKIKLRKWCVYEVSCVVVELFTPKNVWLYRSNRDEWTKIN